MSEQQRLRADIEHTVLQKAKEVRKYIDPNITVAFGVAVVPDAIYDVCSGIQTDVFHQNVVLISYTMFVPYLLLVFQTVLKAGHSVDLQKLDGYLQTAQDSVKHLQEELDGRFSRSITMLNNSRDEMRAQLSRMSSGLTSLRISTENQSNTTVLPLNSEATSSE